VVRDAHLAREDRAVLDDRAAGDAGLRGDDDVLPDPTLWATWTCCPACPPPEDGLAQRAPPPCRTRPAPRRPRRPGGRPAGTARSVPCPRPARSRIRRCPTRFRHGRPRARRSSCPGTPPRWSTGWNRRRCEPRGRRARPGRARRGRREGALSPP
jgi:hypothetical protein